MTKGNAMKTMPNAIHQAIVAADNRAKRELGVTSHSSAAPGGLSPAAIAVCNAWHRRDLPLHDNRARKVAEWAGLSRLL